MFFNDGCYLNEAPITTANVDPGLGSALTFYNRDCGMSALANPVKRGEEEKGSDKPVSIAKWTQGKKNREPKDT